MGLEFVWFVFGLYNPASGFLGLYFGDLVLKTAPAGPPIYILLDGADTRGDIELPREAEVNEIPTCEAPRRLDGIGVAGDVPTAPLEECKLGFAEEQKRTAPPLAHCCNGGVDEVELSPTLNNT